MLKNLLQLDRHLRSADLGRIKLMQQAQDMGLERAAQIAVRLLRERMEPVTLLPWQAQTLALLLETLCDYDDADLPQDAAPLPRASQTRALEVTLGFIAQLPEHTQRKLSCAIALLEAAPLALKPPGGISSSRTRFSGLSPQARAAHLAQWESSPIEGVRAAFHGLKSACMMGYWSQPEVWPAAGYTLELKPGPQPWTKGVREGAPPTTAQHTEQPR